jgi:hypothetical protein
MICQ